MIGGEEGRRGRLLVVLIVVVLVLDVVRTVHGGRDDVRPARAALSGKLCLQAFEVGAARAVLQLAGDLRLLGLGPAAPHGSTPSCAGQPGESLTRKHTC